MKQDPILSLSGAIHPEGSSGPYLHTWLPWTEAAQIHVVVSVLDSFWKTNLSRGWICLSKEELLHNSWKVQYRKKHVWNHSFFSLGKILTVGLSLGERELFSGSNFRSVPGISSCFVSSAAWDLECCFSCYLSLVASMGLTLWWFF